MTIRAKKTGPNVAEGSSAGLGGNSTFKTSISADGKVMTSDSTTGAITSHVVFDRLK